MGAEYCLLGGWCSDELELLIFFVVAGCFFFFCWYCIRNFNLIFFSRLICDEKGDVVLDGILGALVGKPTYPFGIFNCSSGVICEMTPSFWSRLDCLSFGLEEKRRVLYESFMEDHSLNLTMVRVFKCA